MRGLPHVLVLVLVLDAAATAAPTALTSSVTREALEPPVVVVPATAGHTTVERYRARPPKLVSGTPLVIIVRLPDANSPDVVAVADAHRDGNHVVIAIETRRYDGALHANVLTTPYVEVTLGELPAGSYAVDIAEKILHFTKLDAPQTVARTTPGMQSSIALTVQ